MGICRIRNRQVAETELVKEEDDRFRVLTCLRGVDW